MPIDSSAVVAPPHASVPAKDDTKPLSKASAITAITIGGALELYDSGVYNFFAMLIIPLYFPVDNPLGQLLLTDQDFVQLTGVLKQWATESCGERIVSCMEGGYNLSTLGETVRAHVAELQAA